MLVADDLIAGPFSSKLQNKESSIVVGIMVEALMLSLASRTTVHSELRFINIS